VTSHLRWARHVPRGWSVKPLRAVSDYVVSNVDKVPVDGEQVIRLCNYSDVYNNEFITQKLDFMVSTATEDEIRRFGLLVEDVIITKDSESWNDIGVPALVVETADDLVCGYHLALLRPRESSLSGRFLLRCLQAKLLRLQLELAANGVTRFGLPKSDIGSMRLPVPPLATQVAIADYLDRETARLDGLVAAKQRVLDLLADKRKAIIATAVTRGLDPKVKLRDSGVPWLGEIPVHWEFWKVGHLAKVGNGSTPERDNADYWSDGSFPWLNSSVVNQDEVTTSDQFVTETALRECHLPRLQPGTVLVAITGQGKTRGQAVVLSIGATINQHMAFVRPDPKLIESWFLRWLFYRAYEYLRSISDDAGGTKGALTCEDVASLRIPVPPLVEQRAIVEHIARETGKLDVVRAATERTIVLLKDRRAALIAAAVTGQLEVGAAT
jgi:type I restriction enzyme S subunit